MNDADLLADVLAKDAGLIGGVRDDQWSLPTPCAEYDVRALTDHVVGWLRVFAAGANDRAADGDAATFTTADPLRDFTAAADDLVAGWRRDPADRPVKVMADPLPRETAFAITLMEYVTHGCDLAVATGQPLPFGDDVLERAYAAAQATLPPEYRGPGKAFDHAMPVADDAPALDRLLGFLGRRH